MSSNVFDVCYKILVCSGLGTIAEKGDIMAAIQNRELDAVKASPKTHKILFENEKVRILEVKIEPREREPLHTHPYRSVTIVQVPTRLRYYDEKGKVLEEVDIKGVSWKEPVGIHSTENIGSQAFHGYRVELKQ